MKKSGVAASLCHRSPNREAQFDRDKSLRRLQNILKRHNWERFREIRGKAGEEEGVTDSRQGRRVLFNWPRRMRNLAPIAALIFFAAIIPHLATAQEPPVVEEFGSLDQIIPGAPVGVVTLQGKQGNLVTATNGFYVLYGDTLLTADNGTWDRDSGEIMADGHVRIERGGQIWAGEHINYNFKTHQMRSEQFRTGRPPVFAAGKELEGDITNQTYTAQHVLVTTDDVNNPAVYIRARRFRIVPGQYIEAWNAVLYADGVPAFYYPYYKRNLGRAREQFERDARLPHRIRCRICWRTYTWWLNDPVDGVVHADYREKRGPGVGPDLNLHLGRMGRPAGSNITTCTTGTPTPA